MATATDIEAPFLGSWRTMSRRDANQLVLSLSVIFAGCTEEAAVAPVDQSVALVIAGTVTEVASTPAGSSRWRAGDQVELVVTYYPSDATPSRAGSYGFVESERSEVVVTITEQTILRLRLVTIAARNDQFAMRDFLGGFGGLSLEEITWLASFNLFDDVEPFEFLSSDALPMVPGDIVSDQMQRGSGVLSRRNRFTNEWVLLNYSLESVALALEAP